MKAEKTFRGKMLNLVFSFCLSRNMRQTKRKILLQKNVQSVSVSFRKVHRLRKLIDPSGSGCKVDEPN